MNLDQAQRLIQEREILGTELPAALQFRELLSGAAEAIVRRCNLLAAPSGSVTVKDVSDHHYRASSTPNQAGETVAVLRTAATALRAACYAFIPGGEQAVLSCADDVDKRTDAFAAAVPKMATDYYLGPIRSGLAAIRTHLATPKPKASRG